MDILNIDINSLLPYAIEVFTHIYGDIYHSIISKRINRTIILSYHDPEGADNYASFLKSCKQREYSLEFLGRIGIDTKPYKKENNTIPLDDAAEKLLKPYIYSSYFGMDSSTVNRWAPLRAFDLDNIASNNDDKYNKRKLLKNRIELVNYLRGEDKEKLTEETFLAFTETEEYNKLLKKINELREIHDELLAQYNEWERYVTPYEEYANNERKRKEETLQKKKDELFAEIFSDIPESIKNVMTGKTFEEQQKMFFMSTDVGSKFTLETFRSENMDKLISPDVNLDTKSWIAIYQRWYLESIGIKVPEVSISELETEAGITSHLEFLKQEDIQNYIPSEILINRITDLREKKYEEGLKEYYTTRKDFIEIMKIFNNNPNCIEPIYNNIKNKQVCILGQGGIVNNEFAAILFYTVRSGDQGHLFGSLLHEIGHIIDQTENGCGFEPSETLTDEGEKNPYDKNFRKYEKFNETINDIFKIEAVQFFQSRGIYPIEPQEFVQSDISNHNTAAITKELLQPLLNRFRQTIIKAKTNVDQSELTKYIGIENFEALVDAVNKVDYLSRNGVVPKIKEFPDDPMVIEYQEQVTKVAQIYANIDMYSRQYMETPSITPSNIQIVETEKDNTIKI